MRYKTLDGSVKRVASTSGHVVMVGDKFVEVPKHMEAEARALGCISEEMFNQIQKNKEPVQVEPLSHEERLDIVIASIKRMFEDDRDDNFTARGTPNKKILEGLCGFKPTSEEFDAAWEKVQAELDAEDE